MSDLKKETMIDMYPRPINIENTKKILSQMKNSICKVIRKDGKKGTGFFCNITFNTIIIPVFMTNYHVIDDKYIQENKQIKLTINDDNIIKTIKIDKDRIIYINKEYDITMIEIKQKDGLYGYLFLDIDDNVFMKNPNIYYPQKIQKRTLII